MEFNEVVKQYQRMCHSYDDCYECPLSNRDDNLSCEEFWMEKPKLFEETIMNWAHKNPESIYPTILEVLRHIAAYLPEREDGKSWVNDVPTSELITERIPEPIAKEFNIMPINACSLNKYCEEEESEWR